MKNETKSETKNETTINHTKINVILYHGSSRNIHPDDIIFHGLRVDCDFGGGFYLTEQKHMAEEWVFEDYSPMINEYRLIIEKRDVLYLTGIDWLKVILGFRKNLYPVSFRSPVIHGPIANDRMFESFIPFMQGAIGDKRLMECLDFCKLGNQYCLKKPVDGLTFIQSYPLKGLELQKAGERYRDRRRGLQQGLREIYRNQIPGEKFIDDYLREDAYVQP